MTIHFSYFIFEFFHSDATHISIIGLSFSNRRKCCWYNSFFYDFLVLVNVFTCF